MKKAYTLLHRAEVVNGIFHYYVRNNKTGKLYGYDVRNLALEHIKKYTNENYITE
jgi:hypothetical protein